MKAPETRVTRDSWQRIRREMRALLDSREGSKAVWMFLLLIAFLAAISGLNVLMSYIGRDFMSAIEDRDRARFLREAWLYIGVFAVSTVTAVLYRYLEERLGLLWRSQQTSRLLERYLRNRAYFRIEDSGALPNPDQRITEDVRSFTTSTLSFVLMTLNASITVFAFSSVLWSISPRLFGIAVAYALFGSAVTALVGRRLIGLNSQQLDKEANLRAELLQLREHAELVALQHREPLLHQRLLGRLEQLVANSRRMIAVNRNLGFFSNGYNYLIQIIPALIVAPMFMDGEVSFGVVTQSAVAFSFLMGAFSLLITQFQSISTYAAVVARLGRLLEAFDQADAPPPAPVEVYCEPGRRNLAYEDLSLYRPEGQPLVSGLNLSLPPGSRLLVRSSSGHAKLALFRATAGLIEAGAGRILRPCQDQLMFVPERPYLPHGSLRQLLLLPAAGDGAADEARVLALLRRLRLDHLLPADGGLDHEQDWLSRTGLGEQLRLVLARVLLARPALVFLDRLRMTLDPAEQHQLLALLREYGIGYLLLARPDDAGTGFDATLDIAADGSWSLTTLKSEPALVPA
ncbi:MAG: ABC transporter transmembrane domain-containing protein [Stagnimonas sp.]|nr:ABC transporter transmembrane domain-containing protein [Stagnimonas sp.]